MYNASKPVWVSRLGRKCSLENYKGKSHMTLDDGWQIPQTSRHVKIGAINENYAIPRCCYFIPVFLCYCNTMSTPCYTILVLKDNGLPFLFVHRNVRKPKGRNISCQTARISRRTYFYLHSPSIVLWPVLSGLKELLLNLVNDKYCQRSRTIDRYKIGGINVKRTPSGYNGHRVCN